MTRFSVSTASTAIVDADRQRVWAALTDPDLIVRLTPYLSRIDAAQDHGPGRFFIVSEQSCDHTRGGARCPPMSCSSTRPIRS